MSTKIDRRKFVKSTAAIGAGLFLGPTAGNLTAAPGKKDDIHIALIGCGDQGKALFDAIMDLPLNSGVKFKAVCDIWPLKRNRFSKTLGYYKRRGHAGTPYEDYREMLDKEKDNLDAVIIATPDFWHARHTIDCLKAGLHVYCEKEMSNKIEDAQKMVETAEETGKLLQIGHQRRSNPKYLYCLENIINKTFPVTKNGKTEESTLLGQITTVSGQWNRSIAGCQPRGFPAGNAIPQATLQKYGFKNMQQFRDWRLYKGLGGGPIVDLGSHQIDIFSWFLGEAKPKAVMAAGGIDYWKKQQWFDNVVAVYDFETEHGTVRATYQTQTTTSCGGYHEKFMGTKGTLEISEQNGFLNAGREYYHIHDQDWDPWIKAGIITPVPKPKEKKNSLVDSRSSPPLAPHKIHVKMEDKFHKPHLVNFFDAVREKSVKLNCPAEVGYNTAAMVLKVNEAVEAEKKLYFKPEDFKV